MKHLIFALLMIGAQTSFAETRNARISLENTDTADLQSDLAKLELSVHYPIEEISGVCALDIIADSYNRHVPIEKLLERVEILNLHQKQSLQPAIVSSTVMRVPLAPNYVDGIVVRTKNGRSLKEAIIETLGANRKVVVMPRSCN